MSSVRVGGMGTILTGMDRKDRTKIDENGL
jgi:hypothetical protein